MFPYKNL